MRIAQFYHHNHIQIGLIENEHLVPLSFTGHMLEFVLSGSHYQDSGKPLNLAQIRWAPPIHNPSKIIAIGLNYMDHIQESKGEVPKTPMVFAKFPNSLIAHGEEITWDKRLTQKVDFEAELAVVIGKKTSCCPEEKALEVVFGYTCANDVSARDLQFDDRQWVKGKSIDTFCPLGPWIVTPDEIPDPQKLAIQCRVNGKTMQNSNTSLMVFTVPKLISFLSKHFTLMPGDVILTGTPHGVGAFRDPSVYLHQGDEVVVEIEGIGRLTNKCREINNF